MVLALPPPLRNTFPKIQFVHDIHAIFDTHIGTGHTKGSFASATTKTQFYKHRKRWPSNIPATVLVSPLGRKGNGKALMKSCLKVTIG